MLGGSHFQAPRRPEAGNARNAGSACFEHGPILQWTTTLSNLESAAPVSTTLSLSIRYAILTKNLPRQARIGLHFAMTYFNLPSGLVVMGEVAAGSRRLFRFLPAAQTPLIISALI
jgi:hypothetical protein